MAAMTVAAMGMAIVVMAGVVVAGVVVAGVVRPVVVVVDGHAAPRYAARMGWYARPK